jgi:hypothetical protein
VTAISADLREAVNQRAGNRCEYCRLAQDSQVATFPVDHIIPVSLSGPTELENLALACPRCNAGKWKHVEARDAQTAQTVQLFHPRTQKWTDHFRWSAGDPTLIEPITAVGRATLGLLDLNSSQHVAVRSLLRILGLHPPVEPENPG